MTTKTPIDLVDITTATDVTIVATDLLPFSDTSDGGASKKGAVQDILDLVTGDLVLLETQTAATDASIAFITGIDSTYSQYLFEVINFVPSVDGAALWARVSTDTGSTWKSGASDYGFCGLYATTTGTSGVTYDAAGSYFIVISDTGNVGNEKGNAAFKISEPSSSTEIKEMSVVNSTYNAASTGVWQSLGGSYISTTAVDGVRFTAATGFITSGTFKLYGII